MDHRKWFKIFVLILLLGVLVDAKKKKKKRIVEPEEEEEEEERIVLPPPNEWSSRIQNFDAFYNTDDSLTEFSKQYLPALANGYLSNNEGVKCDTMFVSGIYNGESTSPSHRARFPATFAISVTNSSARGVLLDIRQAIYYKRGAVPGCEYELRWYAHRALRHLYVMEIDINLIDGFDKCQLNITNNQGLPSEDISFNANETTNGILSTCGKTKYPKLLTVLVLLSA